MFLVFCSKCSRSHLELRCRGGTVGGVLWSRWVVLKRAPSAGSVSSLRDLSSLFTVSPAVSGEVGHWSDGLLTVIVVKEFRHHIPAELHDAPGNFTALRLVSGRRECAMTLVAAPDDLSSTGQSCLCLLKPQT